MTEELFNSLPSRGDDNLDEQMTKISQSDRETLARINMLAPFINWNEKMAAGLWAYWTMDRSHGQLCDLKPKHGKFSAALQAVIGLIESLSPQAKAEFASDILLEDWEMSAPVPTSDSLDSPSTVIE